LGQDLAHADWSDGRHFFLASGAWWDSFDRAILDRVAAMRADWLTEAAQVVDGFHADWVLSLLRWGTIVGLVVVKRWRHLAVFVFVVLGTETVVAGLANRMARLRPDGIEILADWAGFSFPSVPYAAFTVTLIAMIYALVVPGRPRMISLRAATALIVLVGVARVYLGVDRFTDALGGGVLAVAVPVLMFRFVVPDAVYPVTYARRKTAHLDLTGPRRRAILEALRDQLGLHAVEIEPFGLEGSGGSTPLRVSLGDGGVVFAKLYAQNHLRSDRWYKLGRSLLYGALEDETSYRTVRRLAEHEDHMMRLMEAADVPVAQSFGVVEITKGREYLLVTEFVEGAVEITDAVLDEETVRAGLRAVRAMWDAGLAHRDLKPANILVKDQRVFLIDHGFGEIRPSAWREAADLANLMLTMSTGFPPPDVHRIAREMFSEDDIGEAFAVACGVTIPGQLRAVMKETGRDLLGENRELAPQRPRIGVQRWTPRRIWALSLALGTAYLVVRLIYLNREIAGELL
jgi:tRNA A-37 threonylcarbamoyl transferase component Bud32